MTQRFHWTKPVLLRSPNFKMRFQCPGGKLFTPCWPLTVITYISELMPPCPPPSPKSTAWNNNVLGVWSQVHCHPTASLNFGEKSIPPYSIHRIKAFTQRSCNWARKHAAQDLPADKTEGVGGRFYSIFCWQQWVQWTAKRFADPTGILLASFFFSLSTEECYCHYNSKWVNACPNGTCRVSPVFILYTSSSKSNPNCMNCAVLTDSQLANKCHLGSEKWRSSMWSLWSLMRWG